MPIAPIPELVTELAAGRMIILVDEEDRENEGDLILAADHVSAESINFMQGKRVLDTQKVTSDKEEGGDATGKPSAEELELKAKVAEMPHNKRANALLNAD